MADVAGEGRTPEAVASNFAVWKHYEDRIFAVKESFSRTVSLLLAFAASLLAWGAEHGIDWDSAARGPFNVPLILVIGAGGLVITWFGMYVANDAAIHIASNMKRANRAAALVPELAGIVEPERHESATGEPTLGAALVKVHICRRARRIIIAFGVVFAVALGAALVQLCACAHR